MAGQPAKGFVMRHGIIELKDYDIKINGKMYKVEAYNRVSAIQKASRLHDLEVRKQKALYSKAKGE